MLHLGFPQRIKVSRENTWLIKKETHFLKLFVIRAEGTHGDHCKKITSVTCLSRSISIYQTQQIAFHQNILH